jgi:hypothetical protein
MEAGAWDSDGKLDCEHLLICIGPAGSAVDGRPGRGSVSIDSLSAEVDSVVARLFFGCMLKIGSSKHRLTLGERKVSYTAT